MLLLEKVIYEQDLYKSSLQLSHAFPMLFGDIHYSEGEKRQTNIMMGRDRHVNELCNLYIYFSLSLSAQERGPREGFQ